MKYILYKQSYSSFPSHDYDGRTKTIILVRRGIPGGTAKYCACHDDGMTIMGFMKLSDVRKRWQKEIRWGYVRLVRELDKTPNLEPINDLRETVHKLLLEMTRR